jgi:hypothetical protein
MIKLRPPFIFQENSSEKYVELHNYTSALQAVMPSPSLF